MRVLVTGATGYIGGRLVPRLLERGYQVRVLVRDAARIKGRSWSDQVEVVAGDLLKPESLPAAFQDVEAAYYLVHSMIDSQDFASVEAECARNFAQHASKTDLVVYLGGLLPKAVEVSDHLRSRARVGEILSASVPVTEFRAGPIIGSGSASFEMVRYLTERLPVMITPRWVDNEVQPINIRAVLDYLVAALEKEALGVVDIGAERLTFRTMMEQYAEVRGLKRTIIPVPVLAPKLAALWVGLVTPITNNLAVPLVKGVVHPVVADTERSRDLFPDIIPFDYRTACRLALERTARKMVETRWSSSLGGQNTFRLEDLEGMIREVRSRQVPVPAEDLFKSFSSIGGQRGWLVWQWAWWIRGVLDQLVGGPGLRRGRRDPVELLPGEALDFWRVEQLDPGRRLVLRAEMKVPGKAWLIWEAQPQAEGSRLVQTALFEPKGLGGVLYWYLLYPVHGLIFSDLASAIARDAQRKVWLEPIS